MPQGAFRELETCGDAFRLRGMGLDAELAGTVHLRAASGRAPRATGSIGTPAATASRRMAMTSSRISEAPDSRSDASSAIRPLSDSTTDMRTYASVAFSLIPTIGQDWERHLLPSATWQQAHTMSWSQTASTA